MSAVRDHRRQAVGVLGVVALDRDGDPLRQVPAPGEHAADQGVVDAELLAFVAQPLLGGARDGVEVDLVAGVQAGDHEPADVVQQRGDGELVAFGPADARPIWSAAAGWRGRGRGSARGAAPSRRWTRRSRRLGAVPAIASTPEGLSTSTAVGDAADAAGDDAAAVGEAQHGDRQARRRPRPPRPARRPGRSRRSRRASPARGTRSGPGSARPPRRPRRGGRRARARRWRPCRWRRPWTLPFVSGLGGGHRGDSSALPHRQERTHGLARPSAN